MKVKIEKCNMVGDELLNYNKPNKVYIPLISGRDTDITILVSPGEYVYKGTIIGKSKGDLRIPIFSSVSGTVLDFEQRTCLNGTNVKCIVIENDHKEKIKTKSNHNKKISELTYDEFIEKLKENGIIGLGGAGFPTYIKYESQKKKTLLINAVECEPFITTDMHIAKTKCEEILETIDAIIEINKMEKAVIAIKKCNLKIKEIFDNYIGTYLKIKIVLVDDFYPMGWERLLIKKTLNETYKRLPIEKGIIVNNISTIYAIYEALKYNKPLIERVITFTGDALKKPSNVLIKSGTPIKEVIEKLGFKKGVIIAGGPMMGTEVNIDTVVSINQSCVLCLKEVDKKPQTCIKCGKCIEVCPSKLSPVLIAKSKNPHKLKAFKCIQCGLCSYICPANIDVRSKVCKQKEVAK